MIEHYRQRRHAWAIASKDGGLIGMPTEEFGLCSGLKPHLFRTRREARAVLGTVRRQGTQASIVKVAVKFEVIGRDNG